MKLKVLGSSSSGNCYILQSENQTLILEAGIKFEEVQKALNYKLNNTSLFITHCHADHSKYISNFLNSGIDTYTSQGTRQALNLEHHRLYLIQAGKLLTIGNFKIIPFATEHDCPEPLGFLINEPSMGNLLFATDTMFLRNKFKNLNHIMIECNYAKDIMHENMEDGSLLNSVGNRTIVSHLELQECKDFLKANDLSAVNEIILLHLSSQNSDKKRFKKEVEVLTGLPIFIAEKGLEFNLGKDMF